MVNIVVGRYSHPETQKFWQGWIEPEDKGWIMFVAADGQPRVFLDRDPETGAVIAGRDEEGKPNQHYYPYEGWPGDPPGPLN